MAGKMGFNMRERLRQGGHDKRRIGDPVLAAGPAGVRIRTRIHLS